MTEKYRKEGSKIDMTRLQRDTNNLGILGLLILIGVLSIVVGGIVWLNIEIWSDIF
jgi:hypothetical protein